MPDLATFCYNLGEKWGIGTFECNGERLETSDTLTELLRGAALASDARLVQVEGRAIGLCVFSDIYQTLTKYEHYASAN